MQVLPILWAAAGKGHSWGADFVISVDDMMSTQSMTLRPKMRRNILTLRWASTGRVITSWWTKAGLAHVRLARSG